MDKLAKAIEIMAGTEMGSLIRRESFWNPFGKKEDVVEEEEKEKGLKFYMTTDRDKLIGEVMEFIRDVSAQAKRQYDPKRKFNQSIGDSFGSEVGVFVLGGERREDGRYDVLLVKSLKYVPGAGSTYRGIGGRYECRFNVHCSGFYKDMAFSTGMDVQDGFDEDEVMGKVGDIVDRILAQVSERARKVIGAD